MLSPIGFSVAIACNDHNPFKKTRFENTNVKLGTRKVLIRVCVRKNINKYINLSLYP